MPQPELADCPEALTSQLLVKSVPVYDPALFELMVQPGPVCKVI